MVQRIYRDIYGIISVRLSTPHACDVNGHSKVNAKVLCRSLLSILVGSAIFNLNQLPSPGVPTLWHQMSFYEMTKEVARRTIAIRLWCYTSRSAYLGLSKTRKCPIVIVWFRRNTTKPTTSHCSSSCTVSIHSIIDAFALLSNSFTYRPSTNSLKRPHCTPPIVVEVPFGVWFSGCLIAEKSLGGVKLKWVHFSCQQATPDQLSYRGHVTVTLRVPNNR